MCQFLSAIVVQGGDVLAMPEYTDSHEELIAHFDLKDNEEFARRWIRVEFVPKADGSYANPDDYRLTVDEPQTPAWFSDDVRESVTSKLRDMICRMLVTSERKILLGGCWILGEGANVQAVKNARVHSMHANSNVGEMRGSSKVGVMRGSSNVGVMWESSKVGVMWESSNVGEMRESSKVGVMRGSSKVGVMRGSSNVGEMRESSNVGEMRESSKVGVMRESSKVGVMWESSKVGVMWESSNVGEMRESSNVGEMRESSNVGVDCRTTKSK